MQRATRKVSVGIDTDLCLGGEAVSDLSVESQVSVPGRQATNSGADRSSDVQRHVVLRRVKSRSVIIDVVDDDKYRQTG